MSMFARHRRGRPARAMGLARVAAVLASLTLIGTAAAATGVAALAADEGSGDKVIASVKAPFVTPPTCQSDGLLVVPTQEHILYRTDPALKGEATATAGVAYRITATAKGGEWTIAPGVTTTWTLTPQPRLSEDQCVETDPVDLCSNLDGAQQTIPPGYVPNADGTCSLKVDEGELKPEVTLTPSCARADWTVTNPNKAEEGDSQGGKPIHFFVLIDGTKTSTTPTVLLPQQSATGFKQFDLGSGDHTVTINAGNGRAGGGSGAGSGHTGGGTGGEEGHGPAVTKTVTVSTSCGAPVSQPAASVVGPARPDATLVVKSCQVATLTLTNYTLSPADADATFTVTANGKPWGIPVVVGGGETPVTLTYTRPKGVTKPIELQVLADGAAVESATLPVCAEVEAVVIPGAAPATVEAAVVAADTATLPATGAGSSAAWALAGAAMLAVGGLLVAWSRRRPEGSMTD